MMDDYCRKYYSSSEQGFQKTATPILMKGITIKVFMLIAHYVHRFIGFQS